jgi:hypothetical protein
MLFQRMLPNLTVNNNNNNNSNNDDDDNNNNLFSIPEIHQSGYRTCH